jgi:general secretion pathway protein A
MDGLAFRLSPDPSFYFDSHGHHRALASLRRGLSEGSGFTVISGEIGAGKTTVIRAVLNELERKSAFITVAQIVSTQLDATELLRAVTIAFGLSSAGEAALGISSLLRRFLSELAAQGRRAILVIDEAHNLHLDALDELAALAMRGAPRGRGMQICLVGQPPLQGMLESPNLLAVREQICTSCHLGPIERDEVRPYVEHRLRKVGWMGRPGFDSAAFEEIFRWTEGIPRRINSLCGRLIAACPVDGETTIEAAFVARAARDQRTEFGDAEVEPPPLPAAPAAPVAAAPRAKVRRPLLYVVAGVGDRVRAAALMSAMRERDGAVAMNLLFVAGGEARTPGADLFDDRFGAGTVLDLAEAEEPGESGESAGMRAKRQFERVVAGMTPRAVVVFSWGEAVLGCLSAARTRGVPVVRIGRPAPADAAASATGGGSATARPLPDLWYASDERELAAIECEGMQRADIQCMGSLLIDAVQMSLRSSRRVRARGARHRLVIPGPVEGADYGLVLIERGDDIEDRRSAVALLAFLRRISRSMPLVLLMRAEVEGEFDRHGFQHGIFGDHLWHLRAQAFDNEIELLRHAAFVLTDSPDAQEEALALRVPCLELFVQRRAVPVAPSGQASASPGQAQMVLQWAVADRLVAGMADEGVPGGQEDGRSGDRIADHLGTYLMTARLVTNGNCEQVLTSAPAIPR